MSTHRVIFACPTCGQAVTRPLAPLPPGQRVCFEDGQPAVPAGYFASSDEESWTGSTDCPLGKLPDLVGTPHHPDPGRANGCCGLDGCDGPNLVCGAGHEIGTERSDCWIPQRGGPAAGRRQALDTRVAHPRASDNS